MYLGRQNCVGAGRNDIHSTYAANVVTFTPKYLPRYPSPCVPGHDGDHEPDDEAALRAVFQAGWMVLRRQRPPRRRGVHRRPAEEQAQVSSETLHNLILAFEFKFLHFVFKSNYAN